MAEERREENTAAVGQGADLGALLGGLLGGGASGGLGEGIGAVLRDPEAMAKLPAMIEMLRPMMGGVSSDAGAGGEAVPASLPPQGEVAPRKETPPPPSGKKGGDSHERRIALLCALRPYLNPRRQEAIDYILRMDRMGKLFRQE